MTKPEVKVFAVLKFSYDTEIVLPIEDGSALMNLFSHAEKFKDEWKSGGSKEYFIGGSLPEVTMSLLSEADYAKGKINGEKT